MVSSDARNSLKMNCRGGENCCSKDDKCKWGEGDCDHDDQCVGMLKCGNNNCPVKFYRLPYKFK